MEVESPVLRCENVQNVGGVQHQEPEAGFNGWNLGFKAGVLRNSFRAGVTSDITTGRSVGEFYGYILGSIGLH